MENIVTKGKAYLETVSNPILLTAALDKASVLDHNNDYDELCSYLQAILLNNVLTPFSTSKVLINEGLTLNTPFFPSENIIFEKVFKELIPFGEKNLNKWLRFHTLSKREKEVLRLIANGKSNQCICELLFISINSVKTHRKNIYKKLDINNTAQLVRLAIFLELIHYS